MERTETCNVSTNSLLKSPNIFVLFFLKKSDFFRRLWQKIGNLLNEIGDEKKYGKYLNTSSVINDVAFCVHCAMLSL